MEKADLKDHDNVDDFLEPVLQPLTLFPYQLVMQKRKPIFLMPIQQLKVLLKKQTGTS